MDNLATQLSSYQDVLQVPIEINTGEGRELWLGTIRDKWDGSKAPLGTRLFHPKGIATENDSSKEKGGKSKTRTLV
jgi:hypothetical protein